jgi:hypothetical protein
LNLAASANDPTNMPYIKPENRTKFNSPIEDVVAALTVNEQFDVGEVNYVISSVVWELFKKNPRYSTANNLMGVLECVKAEFYRRQVANLEDRKIIENGDI